MSTRQDKNERAESLSAANSMETHEQESLFHLLLRHKWGVLLTVLLFLAGAFLYIFNATPIFTSTSRMYVEQSGPRIMGDYEGVMTGAKNYLYTQAEILKSTIAEDIASNADISGYQTFANIDNIARYLRRNLDISVGRQDDIISISFDSPYPAEAASVVNLVVESYINFHAVRKQTTTSQVLEILHTGKLRADEELSQKYKELIDFTRQHELISFDGKGGDVAFQTLSELSRALIEARLQTIHAQSDYEAAKAIADDPDKVMQFAAAVSSENLSLLNRLEMRIQEQLEKTEIEKRIARSHVTDAHPASHAIQDKINHITDILDKEKRAFADSYMDVLAQKLQAAKQRQEVLEAEYEMQYMQARELGVKAAEYAKLRSELNRAESFSESLHDRIRTLHVTEDTGALNIAILEVARPEDRPSKPQKARVMMMAMVLGLMAGGGLALVRDGMDVKLRSTEQISHILNVPLLGVIPAFSRRQLPSQVGQKVHLEPKSSIAESYRTIRTAVFFGMPKEQARTIVVTSPEAGDGKSSVASNLAIAMAQAGQRTLILDADFRKPMQHKIFDAVNSGGMAAVIAGEIKIDQAIQPTPTSGLDVLICGQVLAHPSEFINSSVFSDMVMKDLAKQYDRIIIDSPPVALVTDSQILSAICDVTLLVIRANKTTRNQSRRARDIISRVGGTLLGTVANDVTSKSDKDGYYQQYVYAETA